jgi:hypothetical protein
MASGKTSLVRDIGNPASVKAKGWRRSFSDSPGLRRIFGRHYNFQFAAFSGSMDIDKRRRKHYSWRVIIQR